MDNRRAADKKAMEKLAQAKRLQRRAEALREEIAAAGDENTKRNFMVGGLAETLSRLG